MKLVVGLGNPGQKYARTRHNIGFMAVERIAEKMKAVKTKNMCSSVVVSGKMRGEGVILAKPQTYMNLSGEAVAELIGKNSLSIGDLTVLHDDIDIPLGKVKEKRSGGSAGHNGIESIMEELGTGDFRRLRIGVGRPPEGMDAADYVLEQFLDEEIPLAEEAVEECGRMAFNF